MARLWDVGKSEPIKVGKASPTEGTLPGAVYFILKYKDFAQAARANAMVRAMMPQIRCVVLITLHDYAFSALELAVATNFGMTERFAWDFLS